ncbi:MAG: hypothetical protein ACON47_10165 [Flavobacteriaceae bacterium]
MNSSFFYFSMAIGVAFGALGSYLCERKGRSRSMGFLLGFFFGFIGVVIVLFIPKAPVSSSKDQDHSS